VFEIHPVTKIQAIALLSPIADIPGFAPYEAVTAFPYFEGRTATLQASATSVTIEARRAVYNYVGFTIALTGAPKNVADGVFVLAKVLDAEGNVVVARPRRMVFVAGTDAEMKVRSAKKGDRFSVLGIPRVNLERVNYLLTKDGPGPIDVKPPYEMIILGAEEL
jgi:hypothetical protein